MIPDINYKKIGITALVLATIGVLLGIAYYLYQTLREPLVFSPQEMSAALWEDYKEIYFEEETGRTVDRQREDITTSEGQSYTMLRAVWMDDKETFDKSWEWTQEHLQVRPEDELFAWLFGEREDGTYGILEDERGMNTASDADTDIALALIFAFSRWQDANYLEEAHVVIQDIWDVQVITLNDSPYLAATNLEKESGEDDFLVNPSYFSPYAYRIFAEIDPENDWLALVDTSYQVIKGSTRLPDSPYSAGLPPDWVRVNRETGELRIDNELSADYSFDAIRTPWRIAMDWKWFGSTRAEEAIKKMDFLEEEWEENDKIFAEYNQWGYPVSEWEVPAMYGTAMGYFVVANQDNAEEIYTKKLVTHYNPATKTWDKEFSYYDNNWTWFGLAMHNDFLPNLWEEINR